MAILDLFDNRDKKKRLSHIRNLIGLAKSDGTLDKSELDLIFSISRQSGLSPKEFQRILDRPESIVFTIPESNKEKVEHYMI